MLSSTRLRCENDVFVFIVLLPARIWWTVTNVSALLVLEGSTVRGIWTTAPAGRALTAAAAMTESMDFTASVRLVSPDGAVRWTAPPPPQCYCQKTTHKKKKLHKVDLCRDAKVWDQSRINLRSTKKQIVNLKKKTLLPLSPDGNLASGA